MSLEFDDNLEKEKEQFEKISTTEDDPFLNSVELSDLEIDDMSLEQEIEASKANFDRIASVRLAKPICENKKFQMEKNSLRNYLVLLKILN